MNLVKPNQVTIGLTINVPEEIHKQITLAKYDTRPRATVEKIVLDVLREKFLDSRKQE